MAYGQGALNTAQSNVNSAINTGKQDVQNVASVGHGNINSFNPTDVGGTQLGTGPQNATDYMKSYANTIASNPSVTNLYDTANQKFNVPQLANQAAYLNNQVTNIAPNQYSITKGFDVSEPQVENAINTNLRFLQPQATAATNQAQTAQNLASQYVNAGVTQNQMNLLPIQSYGNYLTQEQNNVYQGLIAKLNAGVQLNTAEMQQLSALQQAAASNATSLGTSGANYAAQIAGQQAQLQQANIANKYQTLKPYETLVNTLTGNTYRAGA